MYVPVTDSQQPGHKLLSALASVMVNCLIIFFGAEVLFWMSCRGDKFLAPIITGVIDTPIFIPLTILLLLHPLFMLPSLIASAFYVRTKSKGFFVMSLFLNIINFVYEFLMFYFYVIPWTIAYFEIMK